MDQMRTAERAARWIARLCGLAIFLLVGVLVIGHAVAGQLPNPLNQPAHVNVALLLMAIMTFGLVMAWRWELVGATAALLAWIGFNVLTLAGSGKLAGGAFPIFGVAAALYMAHLALRWRMNVLSSPHPSA